MNITPAVKEILSWYESDCPGTKSNLARLLMHGKLAGTGKLVILPVDQGFEHGPDRSFSSNPDAYDPHYHFQLAIDAGLNAYAAPLGMLEAGADTFAGAVPTILKMNSSNSLSTLKDQAVHGCVSDALRLGCCAIGFTIYPGSESQFDMIEEFVQLAKEAKSHGLAVVLWSYPRGGLLTKEGENALDVTAYAAHLACLIGAHIIKVKPPTESIFQEEFKDIYKGKKFTDLACRIKHIMQACFKERRLVVFSGGAKNTHKGGFLEEIKSIYKGGGSGSIVGRNVFQRRRQEALNLLKDITDIYQGQNINLT